MDKNKVEQYLRKEYQVKARCESVDGKSTNLGVIIDSKVRYFVEIVVGEKHHLGVAIEDTSGGLKEIRGLPSPKELSQEELDSYLNNGLGMFEKYRK